MTSSAAEKSGRRIAVEIQSFVAPSPVRALQEAVGQYGVYRAVLAEMDPERLVYLAVPLRVRESLLSEPLGQLIIARLHVRVVVFDEDQEKVIQWIE